MKLSSSMESYVELMDSMSYDNTLCMGKIESVWYRITDKSDSSMSKILSSCGSKLTKFTDISQLYLITFTYRKLSCTVDGVDPFAIYRAMIGSQQYNCIRFDSMNDATL